MENIHHKNRFLFFFLNSKQEFQIKSPKRGSYRITEVANRTVPSAFPSDFGNDNDLVDELAPVHSS